MFGLYILPEIYILFLAFNSVSMRFKNIPNLHPSGNLAQNAISGVCKYNFVSSDSWNLTALYLSMNLLKLSNLNRFFSYVSFYFSILPLT